MAEHDALSPPSVPEGKFRLWKRDGRKSVECVVEVTSDGVVWTAAGGNDGGGKAAGVGGNIVVQRLIAVGISEGAASENLGRLSLHYTKSKMAWPGVLTKKAELVFTGPADTCRQCADVIEALLKQETDRPKRLLVFVNPGCGNRNGVALYQKTVAPLFELMGVHADVIVTKDATHPSEVIEQYDLSTVEVVVAMGGDGTATLVCNALLRRIYADAGVDLNYPDAVLDKPDVRFGILSAGSGNALAIMTSYAVDLESSALSLVLGHSVPKDIWTMHSGGQFQTFVALLVAYGMLVKVVAVSDKRRWMGKLRYQTLIGELLGSQTPFNVKLDYLPADQSNDWRTSTDTVIAVQTRTEILSCTNVDACSSGTIGAMWMKPCSWVDRFKYFMKLRKFDPSVYEMDFIESCWTSQFKMTFEGDLTHTKFGRLVCYDGELMTLPENSFEIRVHTGLIDMIGFDDRVMPPEFIRQFSNETTEKH